MTGEPADLSEARLVRSSCEDHERVEREQAANRIRVMRREVDAAYKEWADSQPYCWQQYLPQPSRRGGVLWGNSVGDAYGAGGLGLSGIGSGGGGRGAAIGLGSMGTIGHGAGTGRVATARSASGTNNQVAGVHEADLVKTDGAYVYVVAGGTLHIIEALSARRVSATRLEGETREMLLSGDRAVVYTSFGTVGPRCTYGYDCQFAGDGSSTKILVLDIANRAAPRLARKIELSGSLMAARSIGNAIHTVVADGDSPTPSYETWPAGLPTCGTPESEVRKKFAALKVENERKLRAQVTLPTMKEGGREQLLCNGLMKTKLGDGEAFTTLVSFDLRDDRSTPNTATVQSRPGAVFASKDALYLSVVNRKARNRGWYSFYRSVDEVSEIHKFRIGERPEMTSYTGSGIVPGHVLNQFAMDSWYGYLQIATTRGQVPDPKVSSVVSVMAESPGGDLVRVGAIEDIAPGEDIRAVRFDGDRGYVVTFKKTDPLFVMDLYNPSQPRILGELKIPGYSTYMHRIDQDHLLSIGFDADDKGDFAYFNGVMLQLFDVREPTKPRLIYKETIGTRGSSSEAATNHLAFNYFAEQGLLAFPMTICEGGGDGNFGGELTFSGLLIYNVSVRDGFKRLGGVDHGARGASCDTWWSNATSKVKRSVFLDSLVYSIAMDRVKVQRMGRLGVDVADIPLRN